MVPDEERGGFRGTKEFLEHPLFASLNIGYVIDEGMPSGNDKELLIKVDERTPVQIQVTSSGPQAHASGLSHYNCIHTLTNFLTEITAFQAQQQRLAARHEAGSLVSMHITSFSTNNRALNMIPSQAHATIDIRLPSSMPLDYATSFIDALLQKHPTITYEVLATSQERCTHIENGSILYQAVAQAISDHHLTPKPFVFEATTDARFYHHRGIQALGFTPFTVPPNLHGTNESIHIDDITQGTAILSTFLRAFCTVNH